MADGICQKICQGRGTEGAVTETMMLFGEDPFGLEQCPWDRDVGGLGCVPEKAFSRVEGSEARFDLPGDHELISQLGIKVT